MPSARLFIEGKERFDFNSINISDRANSEINSCSFDISNVDFQQDRYADKQVEVYLNIDSIDTVPTFRGIIKELTPSETNVNVIAYDPRILLSSSDGIQITLTDEYNYDGYTLAGFLKSVIETYVNTTNHIRLGVDLLNDTSPAIPVTGIRGNDIIPYDIVRNHLDEFQRSDTLDTPLAEPWRQVTQGRYVLGIENDSNYAQLVFKKLPLLDDASPWNNVHNFSYHSGIQNIKYKKRPEYNVASAGGIEFKFGDTARGRTVLSFTTEKKYPAEIWREARMRLLEAQEQHIEVSMSINKDYYLGVQSIVRLFTDNEELDGLYRIQSKDITYSTGGSMSCQLQLGRAPPRIQDYLPSMFVTS